MRIAAVRAGIVAVALSAAYSFILGRAGKDKEIAIAANKNRNSQWVRSSSFAFIALFFVVWAIAAWPRNSQSISSDEIGKDFFEAFSDLSGVASLHIIAPNANGDRVEDFRIKKDEGGLFVIPSHFNYAADASEQLQNAASALWGLKKADLKATLPSEHAEYGVEEPKFGEQSADISDMGCMVEIRNDKDEVLAHLIIGKPVEDSEGYRFVREPSSTRVYQAKVDIAPFSTNFGDWINTDLLEINDTVVTNIGIRDYAWTDIVDQTGRLRRSIEQWMQLDASWNQGENSWSLESLREFKESGWADAQLNQNEAFNNDAFEAMKTALEGLAIVDIQKKPEGLEAAIIPQSGDITTLTDEQVNAVANAQGTLVDKGYWFRPLEEGDPSTLQLLSSDGELLVRTAEHVEYLLRFGKILPINEGSTENDMRRFLMVSARLDLEGIPVPVIMEMPPLPEEEATTPDEAAPEEDEGEEETEEAETGEDPADNEGGEEESAGDVEEDLETNPMVEPEEETEEASEAEEPSAAPLSEEEKEAIIAERERIEIENQRRIDAYALTVATAENRVRELNERFADWFYVISEEEFEKIHLKQRNVIQQVADPEGIPDLGRPALPPGHGLDVFRMLQQTGLY